MGASHPPVSHLVFLSSVFVAVVVPDFVIARFVGLVACLPVLIAFGSRVPRLINADLAAARQRQLRE